jgi:SAM-dependent methyltransferase
VPSTDSQWESFGKVDPYYGVLTNPKYRNVRSDDAVRDEFFSTGDAHVDGILSTIRKYLEPRFTPVRALDFGCGVGRVMIPLSRHATEVVGVDVSESMLAEAQRNCDRLGVRNVTFLKSDDSLSKVTGSFDFLHSYIVFQHIPPPRGEALFAAILSRLSEGGVGVIHFTLWVPPPSPRTLARRMFSAVRSAIPFAEELVKLFRPRSATYPAMEMNPYDANRLLLVLQENGCHRIHLRFTDHGGARGVVFFFKKNRLPSS